MEDYKNHIDKTMKKFKNDLVKWIVGGAIVTALYQVILHYWL